jgi:hypothetical protein
VLRQEKDQLELLLRTSDTPRDGRAIRLAALPAAASFWTLRFSPGRLEVFRDGVAAAPPLAAPGDFFHWRPRALSFGSEPGGGEAWRGTLAEVAIWNRPLTAEEIQADAARALATRSGRPPVRRWVVEAKLLATSRVPTLDEISPYREALAVDTWELTAGGAADAPPGTRLRVARWAILDGRALPGPRIGALRRMTLEPLTAQAQLEPFFLSDDQPDGGAPPWFDLGAAVEP